MELADRPDLAPARDRGQRQRSEGGWVENLRGGFLKICDILPFFFTAGVLDASEQRRSRVGAASAHVGETKKRKRKEDTRRTPVSGESYPFRCLKCVRHRHDAKNGVSVQPRIAWGT